MAEIACELRLLVAPSMILRWVVPYAAEFQRCSQKLERRGGRSWRADETFIKVRDKWMYLYRAVN
jgi:transposase-like protein